MHQLALGETEVADQAAGIDVQLPAVAKKRLGGGVHSPSVQRTPAGAILLAEEHRFRHGKVRDQVELLVNNADAQRFNRRGIAERQRRAVQRGVAAIGPVDASEDFYQRRFSRAVLADQAVNFTGVQKQRDRI